MVKGEKGEKGVKNKFLKNKNIEKFLEKNTLFALISL